MREKTVICGVPTSTPDQPAAPASQPVPLLCTPDGVPYVSLTDGGGITVTFISNGTAHAPTNSNVPAVAFGYTLDPATNQWLQTAYRDIGAASIAPDPVNYSAYRVQALPYLWSPADAEYVREIGVRNRPSLAPDNNQNVQQAVVYPYMFGVTSTNDPVNVALKPFTFDSMNELGNALVVREQNDTSVHDAPAAATQAQTPVVQGSNGQPVLISGIGFSLTAVNAQAVPVEVTLIEDTGGTANVLWSARLLAPAGTSKEVMLPVNLSALVDCQLTVTAPVAGNFVTATLVFNATAGNGAFPP